MTTLLQQAFTQASHLQEDEQERFARWMLAELESEERWNDLFMSPKSQDVLAFLAEKALDEYDAGKTELLDPDSL